MMKQKPHSILHIIVPLFAGIPLGVWVNIFSQQYFITSNLLTSILSLGYKNTLIAISAVILVSYKLITWAQRNKELSQREHQLGKFHERQIRLLQEAMVTYADFMTRIFRVSCNARYFQAVKEKGEERLYQMRELHVENIPMSAELGFTFVSADNPNIITSRSYKTRTPIYEELPIKHHRMYDEKLAVSIDPRQRWVLSCPVLQIDPKTNLHLPEKEPFGVIVFYGTDLPKATVQQIELAKLYSERLADQFSYIFSIEKILMEN